MALGLGAGIIAFGPGRILWLHTSSSVAWTALAAFFSIYAALFVALEIWAYHHRKQIQMEEGTFEEPTVKLPFYGPDSKGFKWNTYGALLGAIFSGPTGWLMIEAGKAHDAITLTVAASTALGMFALGVRTIFRRAEKALPVMVTVVGCSCGLMLIGFQMRWQVWTGASPWQWHGGALTYFAIGLVVFGGLLVGWLIKRNKTGSSRTDPNP